MIPGWLRVIDYMLGYEEGTKVVKTFFKHFDWEEENPHFSHDDVVTLFDALRQISNDQWGVCNWEECLPWFEEEELDDNEGGD